MGADINGYNGLMLRNAVKRYGEDANAVVQYLLSSGADPDAYCAEIGSTFLRYADGESTPLYAAAAHGSAAIAVLLVEAGARLNRFGRTYASSDPETFQTPLFWTLHWRNDGVALLLIEKGAYVSRKIIGLARRWWPHLKRYPMWRVWHGASSLSRSLADCLRKSMIRKEKDSWVQQPESLQRPPFLCRKCRTILQVCECTESIGFTQPARRLRQHCHLAAAQRAA